MTCAMIRGRQADGSRWLRTIERLEREELTAGDLTLPVSKADREELIALYKRLDRWPRAAC